MDETGDLELTPRPVVGYTVGQALRESPLELSDPGWKLR